MKFFRSRWLQRILLFLSLVFLSTGPFGFIEQERNGKDDYVISFPYYFGKLSGQLRQIQIKYGFDALHITVVPTLDKIIAEDYISGTSFDTLYVNLLTYPSRGPPRLITIL